MYAEVVKTFAQKISHTMLSNLQAPGDERQRISRYIHATLKVVMDNAPAVQLYYRHTHGLPEGATDPDGEASRLREAVFHELVGIFADGAKKGSFRQLDPRGAAVCLIGFVEAIVSASPKAPEGISAEAIAAFVEDLFFHGVLAPSDGSALPKT